MKKRDKKQPNKIYILGTVGTGKTTLAEKLSEKLDIPNYDLDDIYWIEFYTKERARSQRKLKLRKILRKKKWIIEGVHSLKWVIPSALLITLLLYIMDSF